MCLILSGRVIEIIGKYGRVDVNGCIKEIDISPVKDIKKGDDILIFSGKAIEKVER